MKMFTITNTVHLGRVHGGYSSRISILQKKVAKEVKSRYVAVLWWVTFL